MAYLTTVLIPVDGANNGVAPRGRSASDELVAVNATPLIQFALDEAAAAGARRIILIVDPDCTAVHRYIAAHRNDAETDEDFFSRRTASRIPEGVDLIVIERGEDDGLAESIVSAANHIEGERFGIILADDLIFGTDTLTEMAGFAAAHGCISVVGATELKAGQAARHGTITPARPTDGAIDTQIRKMAAVGRYVLPIEILGSLSWQAPDETGRRHLGTAIAEVGELHAFPIGRRHFDCSTKDGLFEASMAIRTRRTSTRTVSQSAFG